MQYPFSFSRRHSFSSLCSLERLVLEIDTVFKAFRVEYKNLSDAEVNQITRAVRSGSYVLSPLRLVALPKETANEKFLQVFVIPEIPTLAFVCIPSSKDDLIFIALSRVLSMTFDSSSLFLDNSFAFRKDKGKPSFFQEIRNMGSVKMLLYVNLIPSLQTISRTRLLAKLRPWLPNPFIYNLILSFFSLSILDEDQRDWSTDSGIPPVGLLTFVLFHFYLDDFDRAIVHRFPYSYVRFLNKAFLAIPTKANVVPAELIEDILGELSLSAKRIYVVPGGSPISIPDLNGVVSVDDDGLIHFVEKENGNQ